MMSVSVMEGTSSRSHTRKRFSTIGNWRSSNAWTPEGLTLDKILQHHPDGAELMKEMPTGIFDTAISTPDKRIDLASPHIRSECAHMMTDRYYLDPAYPLRAHTVREVLTHNSWMHQAKSLDKPGWVYQVRMHPDDAAKAGIRDGDRIRSPYGEVEIVAGVTDKESRGNVGLPLGWGPQWRLETRQCARRHQLQRARQRRPGGHRPHRRQFGAERHPGQRGTNRRDGRIAGRGWATR